MEKNIVEFKKKNVNAKTVNCVNLINEIRDYVDYTSVDDILFPFTKDGRESKKVGDGGSDVKPMIQEVTPMVIQENIIIDTEKDLLEYYRKNNDNGRLENKKVVAEITGISFDKVKRLNGKLKDMGMIETIGKEIYLTDKGMEGLEDV